MSRSFHTNKVLHMPSQHPAADPTPDRGHVANTRLECDMSGCSETFSTSSQLDAHSQNCNKDWHSRANKQIGAEEA